MKKISLIIVVIIISIWLSPLKSQDNNKTVDYINSLLKENPYTDDFQEITFFYSIELTEKNELVVKLEYDGPFKTIFKAQISDLDSVFQDNPTMIPSTHLCWNCKTGDGCVINETIYTSGDKEVNSAGNICVMFSNKKNVYPKLIEAFDKLFIENRSDRKK